MDNPKNGGVEMDNPKNGGGGGDELEKFWGGSKLFPKNWQKYPILACFQQNLVHSLNIFSPIFISKNLTEVLDYISVSGFTVPLVLYIFYNTVKEVWFSKEVVYLC